ncbi:hypothetical protein OF83DRAFT_8309 [Amylostereum chailletii]|nr:hypothetical protein OF83DRAFT_8309 [Amylostereum chailletii]
MTTALFHAQCCVRVVSPIYYIKGCWIRVTRFQPATDLLNFCANFPSILKASSMATPLQSSFRSLEHTSTEIAQTTRSSLISTIATGPESKATMRKPLAARLGLVAFMHDDSSGSIPCCDRADVFLAYVPRYEKAPKTTLDPQVWDLFKGLLEQYPERPVSLGGPWRWHPSDNSSGNKQPFPLAAGGKECSVNPPLRPIPQVQAILPFSKQ